VSGSSLLLRLRAVVGDSERGQGKGEEPEVLGACYSGVLRLEGAGAINWVGQFLEQADDAAAEAALAIAETHTAQAFEVLRRRLLKEGDPWFCSVLLSAIALTRQEAALEFLLQEVDKETPQAEAAILALLRAAPPQEAVQRLQALVAGNRRLDRAFAAHRT
jgi:hypothetical protein